MPGATQHERSMDNAAIVERIDAALRHAEAAARRLRHERDQATARTAALAQAGDRAVAALDAVLAA